MDFAISNDSPGAQLRVFFRAPVSATRACHDPRSLHLAQRMPVGRFIGHNWHLLSRGELRHSIGLSDVIKSLLPLGSHASTGMVGLRVPSQFVFGSGFSTPRVSPHACVPLLHASYHPPSLAPSRPPDARAFSFMRRDQNDYRAFDSRVCVSGA